MTEPRSPADGRRVLTVDLDGPLDMLVDPDGPSTAMVIGYRRGVPIGTLDVALTADPDAARRQLAPLLAAEAPRRPAPVADADLPSISVVVSTIVDRREDLAQLLDGLAALDYPDFDVVVVDNRTRIPADDLLPGILAGRRVRFIREARPGLSAGRNAGVAAATGTIVAFTDDDVRVEPSWLRALGSRFVWEPDLDAVTGLILPAELETEAQLWFEAYYGGFSGERTFRPISLGPVSRLPHLLRGSRVAVVDEHGSALREFAVYGIGAYGAGANMAFRRSALHRVGGFDTALGAGSPARGGEDLATIIGVLWSGGRLGFEPAAVVHHRHRRTLDELQRQLHGYGLGFTAMLTSLVLGDPRHVLSLAWQVPLAGRSVVVRSVQRLFARPAAAPAPGAVPAAQHPRSLMLHELRGYPAGPVAYLRSRRRWRTLPPAPPA